MYIMTSQSDSVYIYVHVYQLYRVQVHVYIYTCIHKIKKALEVQAFIKLSSNVQHITCNIHVRHVHMCACK